jgi:hypothetical protein
MTGILKAATPAPTPILSEQREQPKQLEQREQPEQPKQLEQREQPKQLEQREQSEQLEQREQFFSVSKDALAAASLPQYSRLARFPFFPSNQVIISISII